MGSVLNRVDFNLQAESPWDQHMDTIAQGGSFMIQVCRHGPDLNQLPNSCILNIYLIRTDCWLRSDYVLQEETLQSLLFITTACKGNVFTVSIMPLDSPLNFLKHTEGRVHFTLLQISSRLKFAMTLHYRW